MDQINARDYIESSNIEHILVNDVTTDTINNVLNVLQFILIIEGYDPIPIVTGNTNNNVSPMYLVLRDNNGNEIKRFTVFLTSDLPKIQQTLSVYFNIGVNNNEIFIEEKYEMAVLLYDNGIITVNPEFLKFAHQNKIALENLYLLIEIYNRFLDAQKIGRTTTSTKKLRLIDNAKAQIIVLARLKIQEYEELIRINNQPEEIIIEPVRINNQPEEIIEPVAEVELNTNVGRNANQAIIEYAGHVLESYDRLIILARQNQQIARERQNIIIGEELENEEFAPNPIYDPLEAEEAEFELETVKDNVGIFAAILESAKGDFPNLGDVAGAVYNDVVNRIDDLISNIDQEVGFQPPNLNQIGAAYGALGKRNYAIAITILTAAFTAAISLYYWNYTKTPEVIPIDEIPDILPNPVINPVVDPHYIPRDAEFIQRQVAQARLAMMMNGCIKKFNELWDRVPSILITLPEGTGTWIKWFTIFVVSSLTTYGLSINPYLPIGPSFTSFALTTFGTTLVAEAAIESIFDKKGNLLTITRGTGDALVTVASGATTVITSGVAAIGIIGGLVGITLLGVAGYIIYRGVYKGQAGINVTVKQKQIFN